MMNYMGKKVPPRPLPKRSPQRVRPAHIASFFIQFGNKIPRSIRAQTRRPHHAYEPHKVARMLVGGFPKWPLRYVTNDM